MPLNSLANGFQSEVRFTHAGDILFVYFEFMFLTYRMSVRHDFSNLGIYVLFLNNNKRKHALGYLQIVLTKGRKVSVLLMKVSPFCVSLLDFNAKSVCWISYVYKFQHRIVFYEFLELFMNIFVPWCRVSITLVGYL